MEFRRQIDIPGFPGNVPRAWTLLFRYVDHLKSKEVSCLAAALGPLACLVTVLGSLAYPVAALGPLDCCFRVLELVVEGPLIFFRIFKFLTHKSAEREIFTDYFSLYPCFSTSFCCSSVRSSVHLFVMITGWLSAFRTSKQLLNTYVFNIECNRFKGGVHQFLAMVMDNYIYLGQWGLLNSVN